MFSNCCPEGLRRLLVSSSSDDSSFWAFRAAFMRLILRMRTWSSLRSLAVRSCIVIIYISHLSRFGRSWGLGLGMNLRLYRQGTLLPSVRVLRPLGRVRH